MKTKNIHNFFCALVIALLVCPESNAMTAAQRAAARTESVIRRAGSQAVNMPVPTNRTPATESMQQKRSYSSLPTANTKNQRMTWLGWFTSRFPSVRFFSSKPVPKSDPGLLIEAIKSGSKEKLGELIKKGLVDLNARYDKGDTILHIAAKHNAPFGIITLLADSGADVTAKNNASYTPLHSAVQYDNVDAVKALLFKKADPNAVDSSETDTSFTSIFTNLFQSLTEPKKSPLYLAQEVDKPSTSTKEIIGILEPLTDKALWFQITPEVRLRRAILANNIETVRHLLMEKKFSKQIIQKAFSNAIDRSFLAPAVPVEILVLLIDAGADVTAKDVWKETPLHWAVRREHVAAVKLFLSRGADPNALDRNGETPLDWAKRSKRPSQATLEIIKILEPLTKKREKRIGDMSVKDELAMLMEAIESGEPSLLKQLLAQRKFSRQALNKALLEAAQGSRSWRAEMLAALLDAGADITTKDDYLWERTALHHAVLYNNLASVKLLLARGAQANARDKDGRAPVYLAQENDNPSPETLEIIEVLEPLTDPSLWFVVTPEIMLRRAVKSGNKEKVRSVLEEESEPFTPEAEEPSRAKQQKPKAEQQARRAGQSAQQKEQRTKASTGSDKDKEFTGSQAELETAFNQLRSGKTVYDILGITKESSEADKKKQYFAWVRKHHPDKYPDDELKKMADTVLQNINGTLRR